MIVSPRQTVALLGYGFSLKESGTKAILVMGTSTFLVVAYTATLCCHQA